MVTVSDLTQEGGTHSLVPLQREKERRRESKRERERERERKEREKVGM